MVRLIDADAIKNRLFEQHDRIENDKYWFGSLIKETIMECVSKIESAPTVSILPEGKDDVREDKPSWVFLSAEIPDQISPIKGAWRKFISE